MKTIFTEADVRYLRSVCSIGHGIRLEVGQRSANSLARIARLEREFENRCRVAVELIAFHHERDEERGGHPTGRVARIERLEKELEALNFLLSRPWFEDEERALLRLRESVFIELQKADESPTRGRTNALRIAAMQVVTALRECGIKVDTSKEGVAVGVLGLICRRAGLNRSRASYKRALLDVS